MACKPGTIKPHAKFEGEIYALTKEEGGRHTPFFTNYKPQFFLRTADITGSFLRLHQSLLLAQRARTVHPASCSCLRLIRSECLNVSASV